MFLGPTGKLGFLLSLVRQQLFWEKKINIGFLKKTAAAKLKKKFSKLVNWLPTKFQLSDCESRIQVNFSFSLDALNLISEWLNLTIELFFDRLFDALL